MFLPCREISICPAVKEAIREKISEEIQGNLAVLKSKHGFPDLRIERKCGATERIFELYRYDGLLYKCVRREIHNYLNNSVKIEK